MLPTSPEPQETWWLALPVAWAASDQSPRYGRILELVHFIRNILNLSRLLPLLNHTSKPTKWLSVPFFRFPSNRNPSDVVSINFPESLFNVIWEIPSVPELRLKVGTENGRFLFLPWPQTRSSRSGREEAKSWSKMLRPFPFVRSANNDPTKVFASLA